MKVFVLGGSGRMGTQTARVLVNQPAVSEIVIAGRNLERAEKLAGELGPKATAFQIDATDESALADAVKDADVFANTSGPFTETLMPAVRAAIAARTNYVDLLEDLDDAAAVFELDDEVRAAQITAVVGIGFFPGMTNLLGKLAADQLDQPREVRCCIAFSGWLAGLSLTQSRDAGSKNVAVPALMFAQAGPMPQFRDGELVDTESATVPVELTTPTGRPMTAYPMRLFEALSLPKNIPGLQNASVLFGVLPDSCMKHWHRQVVRIHRGEIDRVEAGDALQEALANEPEATLENADGFAVQIWAEATGLKDSAEVKVVCTPNGRWASTGGAMTAAIIEILEGRVSQPGVFAAEAVFDPMRHFRSMAEMSGEVPEPLVNTTITAV